MTIRETLKSVGLGMLGGLLIIIFIAGFFVSAGFVLKQMGKAMGCGT